VLAHSTATAAEIHLPELDQALSVPALQADGTQMKSQLERALCLLELYGALARAQKGANRKP
jgi:hypothetical protein